jgi:hypothetical protein
MVGINPAWPSARREITRLSREHIGLDTLMNHSDCDGHFTPQECELVAKLIEKSRKEIKDIDFDDEQIDEVIEGFTYCAKHNQKAIFT